jgi:molybdopterin-guanine dinucleotide biosynthesis protein A
MRTGAIILCGGKSSRMGADKATLPFGPELLLPRVVRLVGEVVQQRVVVAAPDQNLPELPREARIARDANEGRGPLEGLAAGIAALADEVDAVYVTSCDTPFLAPAFVAKMFQLLGEHDIAVPRDGRHHHVLASVYRVGVLSAVQRLLAEDRLRPFFLLEACDTRLVDLAELRDVDPELASLENLNREEDYQAALAKAGFGPHFK